MFMNFFLSLAVRQELEYRVLEDALDNFLRRNGITPSPTEPTTTKSASTTAVPPHKVPKEFTIFPTPTDVFRLYRMTR